jgi:hypothetical protein
MLMNCMLVAWALAIAPKPIDAVTIRIAFFMIFLASQFEIALNKRNANFVPTLMIFVIRGLFLLTVFVYR